MIIFKAAIILCQITKVENNVRIFKSRESNFCVELQSTECQITEVVFYTKVLVNDILVGLERILHYADVRLERFD